MLKEWLFVGISRCEGFVSVESMTTCFLARIWGESTAIGSKYPVIQSSSIPIISTQ